jgi:hypothetical protein
MARILGNSERKREFKLKAIIMTEDERSFTPDTLLDTGCTDSAMDRSFVERENIPIKRLPFPRRSMNADETENKNGRITPMFPLN